MSTAIKLGQNLLEINKVNGEYEVLTKKINDELFVQRILYLLTYHADVFAAYYASTVYEDDSEKMMVINNFESEIEKYSISAIGRRSKVRATRGNRSLKLLTYMSFSLRLS